MTFPRRPGLPTVLVLLPKFGSFSRMPEGLVKFGWFRRLKTLPPSCTPQPLGDLVVLERPRSTCVNPGPRPAFRRTLPSSNAVRVGDRECIEVELIPGHAVIRWPNGLSRNQVGTNLVDPEEGRRHVDVNGKPLRAWNRRGHLPALAQNLGRLARWGRPKRRRE